MLAAQVAGPGGRVLAGGAGTAGPRGRPAGDQNRRGSPAGRQRRARGAGRQAHGCARQGSARVAGPPAASGVSERAGWPTCPVSKSGYLPGRPLHPRLASVSRCGSQHLAKAIWVGWGYAGLRGSRAALSLKRLPMLPGIGRARLAQSDSRGQPRNSRVPDDISGLAIGTSSCARVRPRQLRHADRPGTRMLPASCSGRLRMQRVGAGWLCRRDLAGKAVPVLAFSLGAVHRRIGLAEQGVKVEAVRRQQSHAQAGVDL